MKFNQLAPATVSLIVALAVLSACSEKTTTTTATTTGSGSTGGTIASPSTGSAQGTGAATTSAATEGTSSTSETSTSSTSGKSADPNNVSNLKPYAPPRMAPGFPGKGSAPEWTKATKFYNDGIDASGSKHYDQAIKLYKQAIAVYPYDANFYANLGFALERNSNPAGGVEACKKALDLQKGFGGAWENLGNCEYDLGHLKESREAFNQAILCELTPGKREELIKVIQTLTKQIDGSK